jgi:pyruvate/2-oxoglutarate dehydrogenase complex dihydrolipoamide acyltransferase (E2) component
VKHRSPLVTLAAVALAFAIMFTVNMLTGPPGSSSTGTAGPSAAPATATASTPSPQPTETAAATPSASPSESAEDSKFPEKVVYAGRTDDGPAAIAVAVLGDQAAAYFCDGANIEAWFRGTVEGGDISLKSKSGATLQAELDGDHIKGTVKIKNDTLKFEINEAKKPAGLYRARGSRTTIGWIVLEDGSQVGVQTTGAESSAAPRLDPMNPQVTVDGENLDAGPVNGDEEL